MVILFFGPQLPAPFTFLQPPAQITCLLVNDGITFSHSLPLPASKITFSGPLVTEVCHVSFTPLSKTQPTACSKISSSKKFYHT